MRRIPTSPRPAWAALGILLAAGPVAAQDFTGDWSGVADGTVATLRIQRDSAGLHGRVHAPSWRPEPIPFSEIATAGDSIMLTLPIDGGAAVLRGALSPDGAFLLGRVLVGDDVAGAFEFAREGTQAAALIVEPFVERSRTSAVHADPDSAALITSDIELFWEVYDSAPPEQLEVWLRREYLNRGTQGLRDFIPYRILGAVDLAARIRRDRSRYEAVRPSTERVSEVESQIRATFHALKARYPEAVFPDVYFVIGRFNSGGTVSPAGLLIGAEMYRDPARLPMIVAHELVHYQQPPGGRSLTLLERAFREGSADFVGELLSGQRMNAAAQEYGRAHEAELWAEFRSVMHGTDATGWLYGNPPPGRPADLGYFIGYRIAEAYYAQAADKAAALRDILRVRDVERILAASGYSP
ncbi:MAG TPA: DUF2268 domain-containing putative Zn-dependent protease [Longimicrobiales bacterium]